MASDQDVGVSINDILKLRNAEVKIVGCHPPTGIFTDKTTVTKEIDFEPVEHQEYRICTSFMWPNMPSMQVVVEKLLHRERPLLKMHVLPTKVSNMLHQIHRILVPCLLLCHP